MLAHPTSVLRRHCWIALIAMLALALLPTVSHALASWRGQSPLTEVCTPQGSRQVTPDADPSGQGAPASVGLHLEHCPFCVTHLGALGMPHASASTALRSMTWVEKPQRFLHAPCTQFAWCSAQPRAPPISS
ncbi:MAG: DUF2946 domain-containing protein [Rhizobacter sp.]